MEMTFAEKMEMEIKKEQKKCPHVIVELYAKKYAETRFQPAEYDTRILCVECGKWMDISDIDEGETKIIEM